MLGSILISVILIVLISLALWSIIRARTSCRQPSCGKNCACCPKATDIKVLRASEEWQRAGAYSVRVEGMNRQHHIPLRDEFDEHDCDGTKYIVLLDDGYPVATCRFYENTTDCGKAAGSVVLGRVVVLPEYRGQGLGKKVVSEAETWAKELGYKQIDIDSRIEAIKFYEKLGYIHTSSNDDIIKSGSFECVGMFKKL